MTRLSSRRQLLAAAAVSAVALCGTAQAQSPANLKLIITFPPGAARTSPRASCSRDSLRFRGAP